MSRWTSHHILSWDCAWAAASFVLLGLSSVRLAQYSSTPSMALWVFFGPVCSALLVWFAVTRPGAYLQRRTLFLIFLKLGRIYALALTFLAHEDELSPFPDERLSMIMTTFQRAVMLLCNGLGFQLPLPAQLPVQAVLLAVSLSYSCQRCSMDCSSLRGRGFYQGIAARLSTAFSKAFPVGMGGGPAEAALDPCMLVQAWSQVVFGFLLPSVFTDWSESTWAVWDVPRGGGRVQRVTLAALPVASVLGHLSLLAVASPICWKAIELALRVLQAHGCFDCPCGSCTLEPG